MKRAYLGLSQTRQPMTIDCTREYSAAVYQRLSALFNKQNKRRLYPFFKRLFDLVTAAVLLVLFLPLMVLIAFSVGLSGEGSILFRQVRIGKDEKPFICYKFRTMIPDAPPSCPSESLADRERYITAVGRILRRYSLDELPQLFCVLKGDMSLVGYRPLVKEDADCHALRAAFGVYRMRPGMTGYAQLCGRDFVCAKNKALLDAYYQTRAGFFFDLRLLLQTVSKAVRASDNQDAL